MKKIFKILMMSLVLLLSACSIDYKLTVTSDKQFIEEVTFKVARDIYPADDKRAGEVIEGNLDPYKQFVEYRPYSYTYRLTDDWVYITATAHYFDFKAYQQSPLYKNVFQRVVVLEDDTYRIGTRGDYYNINVGDHPDPNFWVDELKVTMRFHNKVIDTNAHNEDFSSNTFEWVLISDSSDELEPKIEIELDYSKRYDIIVVKFLLNNLILIISMGAIIVVSLIIVGMYRANNYNRNKI